MKTFSKSKRTLLLNLGLIIAIATGLGCSDNKSSVASVAGQQNAENEKESKALFAEKPINISELQIEPKESMFKTWTEGEKQKKELEAVENNGYKEKSFKSTDGSSSITIRENITDDAEKERKDSIQKLAGAGNTYAMMKVAKDISSTDPQKSYELYRKAGALGNPEANKELAFMFSTGRSHNIKLEVKRDPLLSLKYYLDAAYMNDIGGQNLVAIYLLTGYGVPDNQQAGEKWLQLSDSKGSGWAKKLNNANSEEETYKAWDSTARDFLDEYNYYPAKKIYEMLIKKFQNPLKADAEFSLGIWYKLITDENNPALAVSLITQAATNGNAGAMVRLGQIYEDWYRDYGVNQNYDESKKWYQQVLSSPSASEYQKQLSKDRLRGIAWSQEKTLVLSRSSYFEIEFVCTDDFYLRSSARYIQRGNEGGVMAVSAFYQMGADRNPNAYVAFSKTPYLCQMKKLNLPASDLEIVARGPHGKYVVKIKGQSFYSGI